MSRFGVLACLLVLVSVAVCIDMPPNMKPPGDLPKDGQGHLPPGHPHHPDASHLEGQHPNGPQPPQSPQLDGQQPKDNSKPDPKLPQEPKS